jgi:type IV pilus assembly protein PilE
VPFKTVSGDALASSHYLMSAGTCTVGATTFSIADCVQVIATPIKPDAEVGTLTMTSTGVKDCSGTAKTSNFALCWP